MAGVLNAISPTFNHTPMRRLSPCVIAKRVPIPYALKTSMSKSSKLFWLVVWTTALFAAGLARAATVSVSMSGFQFAPKNQMINVGDTVMWVNRDGTRHDTTSGVNGTPNGIWRSPLFGNGGSFSFRFNNVGTFPYYCTPHVFSFNMVGTITVVAPNAPPTVNLTNPPSGATFTAGQNVVIQAAASDDKRVARVEFFANGNPVGTDSSTPFSATLNSIAAGNYALTATAFDDQGLSGTSPVVNISVREAPTAPTITSQPQGQNVLPGTNVTFSVVAGGTPPFIYQWQVNGTNISGAISDTLDLINVRTNDAGSYTVLVSNEVGTTPSAPAILTVTPLPNVFPTVTVTSPMDGARFRAGSTVLVRANPFDRDGSIAQVEIFLNTNLVATLTNAPYEIALGDLALGDYSVTARATDDARDETTSDAVSFSVLASPLVTLTQPVDNEKFILGTNVSIAARVDAPGLAATNVQIFEGTGSGRLPISPVLTNAPYIFVWTPVISGTHTLFAIVTDELAGTNSSTVVSIQVVERGSQDPTIAITNSPRNFSRLTNSPISISGVAHDDIGVERVEFQVNEGPFLPASGTNDWIAEISLAAGTNVIHFRSMDFAGNFSTNETRAFTYVVNSRLSVQVRGLGIVSPNLDGRELEIGKFYQMIARPARAQIFGGWEGVPISAKAVLNFAMQSNLVVSANFISSPFSKGIYAGLILETHGVRPESSGFVKLAVTRRGSFSGKLTIAGRTFPLRGTFDYLGRARIPVLRRPAQPVLVTLQIDLNGLNQITGDVTDGHWISILSAEKVLNTATARERIKQANSVFSFQSAPGLSAETANVVFVNVGAGGALKFRLHRDGKTAFINSSLSHKNSAPIYFWMGDGQPPVIGEAHLAPQNLE